MSSTVTASLTFVARLAVVRFGTVHSFRDRGLKYELSVCGDVIASGYRNSRATGEAVPDIAKVRRALCESEFPTLPRGLVLPTREGESAEFPLTFDGELYSLWGVGGLEDLCPGDAEDEACDGVVFAPDDSGLYLWEVVGDQLTQVLAELRARQVTA